MQTAAATVGDLRFLKSGPLSEGSTEDDIDRSISETDESLADEAPIAVPVSPPAKKTFQNGFLTKKAGTSGCFRGGLRQVFLANKFKGDGEIHTLEFFGNAVQSNWTMVNTTIEEKQRVTLGFQVVYGDDCVVRVKEMFREYVAGAHAHYKFEILLELMDSYGGLVYVEIPDHRSKNRAQARECPSGTPMDGCLTGRALLSVKKMDGPVEAENQSACLCCA
jgi:hypothetical protein